jgi:nitrile hydratase subunit beta
MYLSIGYYEIWLRALMRLIVDAGLASEVEIRDGRTQQPPLPVKRVLKAEDVAGVLAKGSPYDRPALQAASFKVGDRVRCRNDHVTTHTRLPRYIRGRSGVIVANHGSFVLPDTNAHGGGEQPTWCYGVRFDGRELWGSGADPTTEVMVDCWEPYLERA